LLNFTWPLKEIPFASALVFELRKSTENQSYYVQILYKENGNLSSSSELTPVKSESNKIFDLYNILIKQRMYDIFFKFNFNNKRVQIKLVHH
jgi:hypothetical protein